MHHFFGSHVVQGGANMPSQRKELLERQGTPTAERAPQGRSLEVLNDSANGPTRDPRSCRRTIEFLLERIDLFMEREHPDDLALLIYDSLDPGNAGKFAASLDTYMERGGGRNLKRVVPSALFATRSSRPAFRSPTASRTWFGSTKRRSCTSSRSSAIRISPRSSAPRG